MAAAADGLAAAVLPGQAPLVAAQPPARPEVGRAVSRDLVIETEIRYADADICR